MTLSRGRTAALMVVAALALAIGDALSWSPGVPAAVVEVDLAIGTVFTAAGAAVSLTRANRHAGSLLFVVGATWFAGAIWPSFEFLHRGALLHLVATYPDRPVSLRDRGVRARARTVVVAIGYLANLTRLGHAPIVACAYALGLAWAAVDGVLGIRGTARRSVIAATVAGSAVGAVTLVEAAVRLLGGRPLPGALFAYEAVLALAGLVLAADLLASGWWSAAGVAGAVVDLGDAAAAGSIRDRLARSLGDPSLVLAFAVKGRPDAYVDEAGRPASLPVRGGRRSVAPIWVGGEQVGAVGYDAALLADDRLVTTVASAAGLALANSRLQAQARAQVVEVAASRERLVQAADVERRRLEARLRSGAMERLARAGELLAGLAPSFAVGSAAGRVRADVVRADVERALVELADFARGVHPAVLTTAGLGAALGDLVARAPLPATLEVDAGRADALSEATLYFVCSEAIANAAKHADATQVAVTLRSADGVLRLQVADDGRGGARIDARGGLRGLADRVEAIGGGLHLESAPGVGTTISVELPLHPAASVATP